MEHEEVEGSVPLRLNEHTALAAKAAAEEEERRAKDDEERKE